MDTNLDRLPSPLPDLKDRVRHRWGKLTAADVQQLGDKPADLINVLRARYGYGQAQAAMEINQWLTDCDTASGQV